MAKIKQGRIDGIEGMSSYSADELFVMAEEYESKIDNPNNTDDSKWLKRRADKLRALAVEKEKAKEHKAYH
ncbi:MAG: hypothetical protein ABW098_15845 [Candidatus Thiodiazotropha sp.]